MSRALRHRLATLEAAGKPAARIVVWPDNQPRPPEADQPGVLLVRIRKPTDDPPNP